MATLSLFRYNLHAFQQLKKQTVYLDQQQSVFFPHQI